MSDELPTSTPRIHIDDMDMGEILSVIGFPSLSEEDFPFDIVDMINFAVTPAFWQFQRYNPFVYKTYQGIGQSFQIPFPTVDDHENEIEVTGVVDCRISVYQTAATLTGNPFADFRLFDGQIMNRFNKSGLPYEKHTSFLQEIENRTWINLRKTGKYTIDRRNKQLIGHTSMVGDLEVHWAYKSIDFDDIQFTQKEDVIRLAQANVLRYVAMFDSQQQNNTSISFDPSHFLERADKLEDSVLPKWRHRSKVVVLS